MSHAFPLVRNEREPINFAGQNVLVMRDRRICGERFNTRDRCDILAWQTDATTNFRVAVHQLSASDTEWSSEFLLAYKPQEQWASWGMARQNNRLTVWCCAAGEDLGPFSSIQSAFRALSATAGTRWKRATTLRVRAPTKNNKVVLTLERWS